ncbi:MAG: NfeD family protein [Vallitaleaceae bacterium]|jgi:membrane protein implicated in regulation of membrane protease activity|nr:NfeD family protein [Vallitaleaceae bacterium]
MDDYIIWLIIVLAAALIEGLTLGLTSIWFVPSGLIVLLLSFTGIPMWSQILIFIVLTALSLIFLYPLVKTKLKLGKTKTNYETVIGKIGVVIITINNMKAVGQVKVEGRIWTARTSNEDAILEEGLEVKVLDVKGVKLIVEKVQEG